MRKSGERLHRRRLIVITGVVLSLLWSMSMVSVSSAQAPGAVCVLKIAANGRLVGILVDQPDSVNSAVLLANQEAHNTAFRVELFTHDGESFCFKDGFGLQVNGGTGVTFADCQ